MHKKILVVVAHPDDEVLGCGGTMARHVNNRDKVHVVFMSNGVTSRMHVNDKEIENRKRAAINASNVLGVVNSSIFLDFPDNRMDTVALLDIVQTLEQVIHKIGPEVVYTHHLGDLNIDHQTTHKAVMTACRSQPGLCVKEIYAFEVTSSTEWQTPGVNPFCPNVFIDIADYIDLKKKALKEYAKEMRQPPHSRSIDNLVHLNALRGNSVGVDYAEAFVLLRKIK
jgi:N-acetylglucosamine malate deacetylase 1